MSVPQGLQKNISSESETIKHLHVQLQFETAASKIANMLPKTIGNIKFKPYSF